eukprot:4915884-Pleurochrysis_carterae.AAC.6
MLQQLHHAVEPRIDRVQVVGRLDQRRAQQTGARRGLAVVEHTKDGRLGVARPRVLQELKVAHRRRVNQHHAVHAAVFEPQRALDKDHVVRLLRVVDQRRKRREAE